MTTPLVIAVAANGALATKAENPAVPYTPAEIADEIIRAAAAGAALAHVHTRSLDGGMTQDIDDLREIIRLVRTASDIVIEVSLGSPGYTTEQALEPLTLKPVMASFPMTVRRDAEAGGELMKEIAGRILAAGTLPSFVINSPETKSGVFELVGQGLGGPESMIVVGANAAPDDALATAEQIVSLTADMTPNMHWMIAKSGKAPAIQYSSRALAIAAGGHVRVGFEDTVFRYDNGGLAPSNAWFVERMVELAGAIGRSIATPGDLRAMLKI